MSKQYWIGIDVGKKGAMSVINEDNRVVIIIDYTDNLREIIKSIHALKITGRIKYAAIEKVSAMPKQGVTSMFNFGTNYGMWQGLFTGLGIPFVLVRPQEWMKGVIPPKSDKKTIAGICSRMYPDADLYGPKGGLKDGRSDATLIASWCKKTYY